LIAVPLSALVAEVMLGPHPDLRDDGLRPEVFDAPVGEEFFAAVGGLGLRGDDLDDEARIMLDEREILLDGECDWSVCRGRSCGEYSETGCEDTGECGPQSEAAPSYARRLKSGEARYASP
jgi:hypothetical protein